MGHTFITWGTKICAGVQQNTGGVQNLHEGYILQTIAENCIHNYRQTQLTGYPIRDSLLIFYAGKGLEQFNETVRWTVAADGLTEANLYFLSRLREKMQTSPFCRTN